MLDIPSITGIVGTVGVIVGVGFTVMELRNLVKARKTDLTMRLASAWHTEGLMEKWLKVMNLEFKDYSDFKKRWCITLLQPRTHSSLHSSRAL